MHLFARCTSLLDEQSRSLVVVVHSGQVVLAAPATDAAAAVPVLWYAVQSCGSLGTWQ
jgi:hypothetical protein